MAEAITKPEARAARARIRAAEQKDGEALADLRRQNAEAHARLLPDYFRVPSARDANGSRSDPSSVILVADGLGSGGKRVLGYVAVKVAETPRDPTMTPRRRAYVDEIVVDEGHRGAGIGTALMRAASEWARRRDAVEMVLTVWSDNRAAAALYRRLGYEPVARVLRRALDS